MPCIYCFGDSNTYGFDPRSFIGERYEEDARWPEILADRTGWSILNLGVNGLRIPHTERETEAWIRVLETRMPPAELILIMLGSNDIANMRHPDAEKIGKRMEDFLARVKERFPNTKLLLLSPPPAVCFSQEAGAALKHLPECYRDIAVRMGTSFADPGEWNLDLAYDGIHLSEEGHREFARRLEPLLRKIFSQDQIFI